MGFLCALGAVTNPEKFAILRWEPKETKAPRSSGTPLSPSCCLRGCSKNEPAPRPFCIQDRGSLPGVPCNGDDRSHLPESLLGPRECQEKQRLKCNPPGDQGSRLQWQILLTSSSLEVVGWERHFSSMFFLPRACSPSMRKTAANPSRWAACKTLDPYSSQLSTKTRKVRHCHSPEGLEEMWQLNVMCCPGWDPAPKKSPNTKN